MIWTKSTIMVYCISYHGKNPDKVNIDFNFFNEKFLKTNNNYQ